MSIIMKTFHILQHLGKCLVLAAITLGVLSLHPTRLHAGAEVSFHGSFQNNIETVVNFPLASVTSTGAGHASLLGAMTTEAIEETVNLVTGEGVAKHRLTAANGDEIIVEFQFWAIPDGLTFTITGSWSICGGTGRFTGGYGSGTYEGHVEFVGPTSATGHFQFEGSISSPGSIRQGVKGVHGTKVSL